MRLISTGAMPAEAAAARPLLGAVAVVIEDGRVLLVQRSKMPSKGLWGFPGGHVEMGETALDAARRELAEETGVIAEALEYLTNIDVIVRDTDGGVQTHYLLAVVLCRYLAGAPVAADDAADAGWFTLETVQQGSLPMSPRVGELVQMAQARRRIPRNP